MNSIHSFDDPEAEAQRDAELDKVLATIDEPELLASAVAVAPNPAPAASLNTLMAQKLTGLPPYSFPVGELTDKFKRAGSATLVSMLRKMWDGLDEREDDAYLRFRELICLVNIELNERLYLAPRVRPMRKKRMDKNEHTRGNAIGDPREHFNSRDRQVVDLHWLWKRGQEDLTFVWGLADDLTDLCPGNVFNFHRAAEFAQERKHAETKAKEVGVSRFMEFELSTIQRERTPKIWKDIMVKGREFELYIRECAETDHRLKSSSERWKWVWVSGQLAKGNPQRAREFYELMTGSTVDPANFSKRLKRVNEYAEACFG